MPGVASLPLSSTSITSRLRTTPADISMAIASWYASLHCCCRACVARTILLRDLAEKVHSGAVPLDGLHALPDEEVIETLLPVRGIGRWTAEMFLMFQLGRLDVWPADDFGVRKGYARLFALAEAPTARALEPLGEPFRPYRSVAAWYCWRAAETVLPQGAA